MKISIVYLEVVGKSTEDAPEPSYYAPFIERFADTFYSWKPSIPYEFILVRCGIGETTNYMPFALANRTLYHSGPGWDCGTYQRISHLLDCDMAVFMATPVYFWKEGWLERLALAWALFGPGLYGAMASYENQPHLRTSCIACSPALFNLWPKQINTHADCSEFEQAFSLKVIAAGGKCKLVTWDGFYDLQDWRKPNNIFRRGDQSNTIVRDRHWDIYHQANDPAWQERASARADGNK